MGNIVGQEELAALKEVIDSGQMCRLYGQMTPKFERAFAEHIGVKHAWAVNSGSAALHAALACAGIGPGDEVICTAYSYIASSACALQAGATPVFADIDRRTFCLDPADVEKKVTPRTKAVIVVHIFGQPARMDEFVALCKKRKLLLVEDCCQAYDAAYGGRRVGSIGDIGCFSLQQSKHITCGDGGILTTNRTELLEKAILFCNFGQIPGKPYNHHILGFNYRISELQSAVALAQLGKIEKHKAITAGFVARVEEILKDVPEISLAYRDGKMHSNYWAYMFRLNRAVTTVAKADLIAKIKAKVAKCSVGGYIPRPNYMEPMYLNLPGGKYHAGLCPVLEEEMDNLMVMGIHHSGNEGDVVENAAALKAALVALRK